MRCSLVRPLPELRVVCVARPGDQDAGAVGDLPRHCPLPPLELCGPVVAGAAGARAAVACAEFGGRVAHAKRAQVVLPLVLANRRRYLGRSHVDQRTAVAALQSISVHNSSACSRAVSVTYARARVVRDVASASLGRSGEYRAGSLAHGRLHLPLQAVWSR